MIGARRIAGGGIAALLLVAGLAAAAHAGPPRRLGALYRYWDTERASDLRDYVVWWAPGWYHVQFEYWDFVAPESRDHARPEVGLHLRDRRRSVYTVQWRHEYRRERFTLGTDQVLGDRWVGRVEVSPIVWPDSTQVVLAAGADYYWGSWSFASATVIRDPREDDLWVVPLRARLANEADDWVQATLAPASRRSLGWALDIKVRGVRFGIERNNRYDFTDVDNVIFTIGYERSFLRDE